MALFTVTVAIGYSLTEDNLVELAINISWCGEETSSIVSCLVTLAHKLYRDTQSNEQHCLLLLLRFIWNSTKLILYVPYSLNNLRVKTFCKFLSNNTF